MVEYAKITARAARINAGFTQVEAAKRLGISKSTLISYEHGKTSPPWEIVEKMGTIYNYPKANFIFRPKCT